MPFNLVDLVEDQLKDATPDRLLKLFGKDSPKTKVVIDAAVPGLLSGMTELSKSPAGLGLLFSTVESLDDSQLDSQALSAKELISGNGDGFSSGDSSLETLFGQANVKSLINAVSDTTNVSEADARSATVTLFPVVISVVKHKLTSGDLSPSGLAALLSDQTEFIDAAMPANVKDRLTSQRFMSPVGDSAVTLGTAPSGASRTTEPDASDDAEVSTRNRSASNTGHVKNFAVKTASNAVSSTNSAVGNFGGSGGTNYNYGSGSSMWKRILPIIGVLLLGWIVLNLVNRGGDDADKTAAAGAADAVDAASDVAESAVDAATDVAEGAADAVTDAAEGVEDAATDAAESAVDAATDAVEGAEDAATDAVEGAEDAATDAVEGAEDAATDAAEIAEDAATDAVDRDDEAATDAAENAEDAATDATENAEDAATDAVDSVEDAATDAAENAEDAVTDAVDSAEDAATDAVDSVEDAATDAAESVEDTAADAVEGAEDAATDTADGAEDAATDAAESVEDAAADAAEGAEDAATDTAESAEDAATDAVESVEDAAAEGAEDAATDVAEGAEDAATDAAGSAEDAATDAAEGAENAATEDASEQTNLTSTIQRGSFSLGAMGRKLGGVFGTTTAVLSGVTDAESAQSALPKLQTAGSDLDEVFAQFELVPESARGALGKVVDNGISRIKPIADTVLTKEGVGDVLTPVIGPMLEKLGKMVQ
ncbi:MAG: DUF937 domain-containing protein [Granulosicoccus sp.]